MRTIGRSSGSCDGLNLRQRPGAVVLFCSTGFSEQVVVHYFVVQASFNDILESLRRLLGAALTKIPVVNQQRSI